MMQRIGSVVCAVLLLTAGAVWAQSSGNTEGTVAYVDIRANTITFTDGRIVHFDPRSKILVNGKEVVLGEVKPGSMVVLVPGTAGTVVTAPPVVATPPTVTVSPPPTATITQGASVP